MTPKQLAKKISELCLHRDTLEQERSELLSEVESARQLPSVSESVKKTAKYQSQVDALDAELGIVNGMIDDESNGLHSAIEELEAIEDKNDRDHEHALRKQLSDMVNTEAAKQARQYIGAMIGLHNLTGSMVNFEDSQACKSMLRPTTDEISQGFDQHVQMPERPAAPAALEALKEARAMQGGGTPVHTPQRGGSVTQCPVSAEQVQHQKLAPQRRLDAMNAISNGVGTDEDYELAGVERLPTTNPNNDDPAIKEIA